MSDLVLVRFTALRLRFAGAGRVRPARLRLARTRVARAAAVAATWTVAGVTLFYCYLHVSRTSPVTSDGASNALQAWDMLHGNPMLRGWQLSDVSFFTTELPQYALIEKVRGLSPDVVHIGAAMTYAMLVLLAAALAQGRTRGREAIVRSLIAAGIMLAPQAGDAVYVLLGSPDHVGSTVPVLLAFLVLDRSGRRWYVPPAVGALLCLGLVADQILLVTGVLPVIAVGIVAAYRRYQKRAGARGAWFDLGLAAAAGSAAWLADLITREIGRAGGFTVWPVATTITAAGDLPRYLASTGHGLLLLFGADFFGQQAGPSAALIAVHTVGLGLVAWAVCASVRHFGRSDLAARLITASILITVLGYVLDARAADLLTVRDITPVLPLGAALASRQLAGRMTRARLLFPLTAVLAAYVISLGQLVGMPAAAPHNAGLVRWLASHHLADGLAGYWDANVTTLNSGGQVRLRSVSAYGNQVVTGDWEVRSAWYDPARYDANFIVLVLAPPGFKRYVTIASVRQTFGQPARIYYLGSDTVCVFDRNLLATLARRPAAAPAPGAPGQPGPSGPLPIPVPPGR